VLEANGKQSGGPGRASAVVTADLVPEGGGTRVTVQTDLTIAGPLAQFGRGAIAQVSTRLLDQFVTQLQQTVLTSYPASPTPDAAASASAPASAAPPSAAADAPPIPASAAAPEAAAAPGAAAPPGAPPPADLLRIAAAPILVRLIPALLLVAAAILLLIWLV
jgi:hypothetical protein